MNSSTNYAPTHCRSGRHPVDSIPNKDLPLVHEKQKLQQQILQKHVGSLNWLCTQTRPYIATITNIIAQHTSNPSDGHITNHSHSRINAICYILKYLKGTSNMGISFSIRPNAALESFVKYPVDSTQLFPLCDANWGSQDQEMNSGKVVSSPVLSFGLPAAQLKPKFVMPLTNA
jgi:hypothetical protein